MAKVVGTIRNVDNRGFDILCDDMTEYNNVPFRAAGRGVRLNDGDRVECNVDAAGTVTAVRKHQDQSIYPAITTGQPSVPVAGQITVPVYISVTKDQDRKRGLGDVKIQLRVNGNMAISFAANLKTAGDGMCFYEVVMPETATAIAWMLELQTNSGAKSVYMLRSELATAKKFTAVSLEVTFMGYIGNGVVRLGVRSLDGTGKVTPGQVQIIGSGLIRVSKEMQMLPCPILGAEYAWHYQSDTLPGGQTYFEIQLEPGAQMSNLSFSCIGGTGLPATFLLQRPAKRPPRIMTA